MRTGKSNQEDEEYEDDEMVAKREGPSSTSNANSSIGNSKGILFMHAGLLLDPIPRFLMQCDVMLTCP